MLNFLIQGFSNRMRSEFMFRKIHYRHPWNILNLFSVRQYTVPFFLMVIQVLNQLQISKIFSKVISFRVKIIYYYYFKHLFIRK